MDEDERCRKLEDLCGGIRRAERLQSIWNSSYPRASCSYQSTMPPDEQARLSRIGMFVQHAELAGFSNEAIDLFLTM